jgi:hypothetical protein
VRPPADDHSPAQRRLLADVAEQGLHVVHVAPGNGAVAHAYSVGLWHHFAQPEVIVFGLDPAIAAELLEAVADEADAGHPCTAGSARDDLLRGYPVRFLAVPPPLVASHLPLAHWAYEGEDPPAVQLVWPDKQGRWPWQDDVRSGFAALQPLLDRLPRS